MSKRKLQQAQEFSSLNGDENFEEAYYSRPMQQESQSDREDITQSRKSLRNFRTYLEKQEKSMENGKTSTRREKVLVLCSRGTTSQFRHLMLDVRKLLPHAKKDVKLDAKDALNLLNEICELKNCTSCIYFETRKKSDCYMWISRTPNGPSAKFYLTNVHTLAELKLIGNCLLGSRPILMFDKNFDNAAHWQLLKALLCRIFATPNGHPKSKPFIDHIMSFFIVDNRIWFRHFQIVQKHDSAKSTELLEIGPRFVLNPIRIFSGSFGGPTLFYNAEYVSPNEIRIAGRIKKAGKYASRLQNSQALRIRKDKRNAIEEDPEALDSVFNEK